MPYDKTFDDIDGTWEGALSAVLRPDTVHEDSSHAEWRVAINGEPVALYTKDLKTNQWRDRSDSLRTFRFQKDHATIVGSFLQNGRDQDGPWVEYQSLILTRKDRNTLLVYHLRVVNNVAQSLENPQSKWGYLLVGELKKTP
ncbi:MAG: hypothetical protein ACOYXR_10385 [Nitrospirota bacterium]